MSDPFDVKPKHWWGYLNPFEYKRRRIIKAILKYQWEHGGKDVIERKLKNMMLYGNSEGDIYKAAKPEGEK